MSCDCCGSVECECGKCDSNGYPAKWTIEFGLSDFGGALAFLNNSTQVLESNGITQCYWFKEVTRLGNTYQLRICHYPTGSSPCIDGVAGEGNWLFFIRKTAPGSPTNMARWQYICEKDYMDCGRDIRFAIFDTHGNTVPSEVIAEPSNFGTHCMPCCGHTYPTNSAVMQLTHTSGCGACLDGMVIPLIHFNYGDIALDAQEACLVEDHEDKWKYATWMTCTQTQACSACNYGWCLTPVPGGLTDCVFVGQSAAVYCYTGSISTYIGFAGFEVWSYDPFNHNNFCAFHVLGRDLGVSAPNAPSVVSCDPLYVKWENVKYWTFIGDFCGYSGTDDDLMCCDYKNPNCNGRFTIEMWG